MLLKSIRKGINSEPWSYTDLLGAFVAENQSAHPTLKGKAFDIKRQIASADKLHTWKYRR